MEKEQFGHLGSASSDSINDGGPAFPHAITGTSEDEHGSAQLDVNSFRGMSLRDYFAAAALQGMLTTDRPSDSKPWCSDALYEKCAYRAYGIADAMLKARQA